MREFVARFRPLFVYAAGFSFVINLLLLVPSLYMLQVFDRVISSRSPETLVLLTLATAFALFIMMLLEFVRARLLAAAGLAIEKSLGPTVLEGLLKSATRLGGADYIHGLRDVAALRAFLAGPGIFSIFDSPWLPAYLAVIYLFHPLLGVTATIGAAILVGLAIANERLTRRPIEEMQAESRNAGRFIDAGLRNAEVVSALGIAGRVTQHWERRNDRVLNQQHRTSRVAGIVGGATKFFRQFLQIAMLGVGAYLVIAQNVTPGIMIAGTIILGRALAPVEQMIAGWKSLVEARAAYRRLQALLEREQSQAVSATDLPSPTGAIEVERLVFGARTAERPIIKGISFSVSPGEALAIIGPSASGKSTLARLLIGAWKALSGAVRLDGADISQWPRDRIGPFIGYLPQDVELFSGTVADNIARLGPADGDAVVNAAHRANAHEMILRLPQGYDTQIGEGGSALSAGQRQRIALARAVFGTPRLVVLDEPNANLDGEGELALVKTMQELKAEGVTQVLITHRPTLIGHADKVLVLQDGQIQYFGATSEVMKKLGKRRLPRGPLYAVDPAEAPTEGST